ncbi:MAG: energy transducer TonB [Steroidobacteraceae bacterium]
MGDSLADYREGWAQLDFMVDTNGKPYEVIIVRSTGDKNFETAAIGSLEASTFEPAMLDGKPVESEFAIKFVFGGGRPSQFAGAKGDFAESYKKFTAAVGAGERVTADATMKRLVVTNLYEDAYYGLAQYNYVAKWGTRQEQLEGVRGALAFEARAS